MKVTTLECIEPLLAALRGYFHATLNGIVADVRLAKGQLRMPASTAAEQSELLGRIEDVLAAMESHAFGKQSGTRQRR